MYLLRDLDDRELTTSVIENHHIFLFIIIYCIFIYLQR